VAVEKGVTRLACIQVLFTAVRYFFLFGFSCDVSSFTFAFRIASV